MTRGQMFSARDKCWQLFDRRQDHIRTRDKFCLQTHSSRVRGYRKKQTETLDDDFLPSHHQQCGAGTVWYLMWSFVPYMISHIVRLLFLLHPDDALCVSFLISHSSFLLSAGQLSVGKSFLVVPTDPFPMVPLILYPIHSSRPFDFAFGFHSIWSFAPVLPSFSSLLPTLCSSFHHKSLEYSSYSIEEEYKWCWYFYSVFLFLLSPFGLLSIYPSILPQTWNSLSDSKGHQSMTEWLEASV